jgi:hypothetical protein
MREPALRFAVLGGAFQHLVDQFLGIGRRPACAPVSSEQSDSLAVKAEMTDVAGRKVFDVDRMFSCRDNTCVHLTTRCAPISPTRNDATINVNENRTYDDHETLAIPLRPFFPERW